MPKKKKSLRPQQKLIHEYSIAPYSHLPKGKKQPKCPSVNKWMNKMCILVEWNIIQQ